MSEKQALQAAALPTYGAPAAANSSMPRPQDFIAEPPPPYSEVHSSVTPTFGSTLISLFSVHNRYVSCDEGENVSCRQTMCRHWESFKIFPSSHEHVFFISHHARYLNVHPQTRALFTSEHPSPDPFCIEIGQGTISLRSANGQYMCAEPDGRLVANRNALGPWEQFTMSLASGSTVALSIRHNNTFLRLESPEAVVAEYGGLGSFETFLVVQTSNGKFGLQATSSGKFLCAEANGTLVANRGTLDIWETFSLELTKDSGFIIRTYHGTYISAQNRILAHTHKSSNTEYFTFDIASLSSVPQTPTLKMNTSPSPRDWIQISLFTNHGSYVAVDDDHQAVCKGRIAVNPDPLRLEFVPEAQVVIQSRLGNYFCATAEGSTNFKTPYSSHGHMDHLRWQNDGDCVAFKSSSGKYLSAEVEGCISANRQVMDHYEKFTMSLMEGQVVALRSIHSDKLLCVESTNRVVTNREAVGAWEKFHVVRAHKGKFGLLTHLNTYLNVNSSNRIVANAQTLGEDGMFSLHFNPKGGIALRSSKGTYLCAEPNGLTLADRPSALEWEAFRIIRC